MEYELSAQQSLLLAALLEGNNLTQASIKAGVSRSTASNWRDSEPFRLAYRAACDEVVAAAFNKVSANLSGAIDTLDELTRGATGDKGEATRVRAASAGINAWAVIGHAQRKEATLNELETALKLNED